MRLPVFVRGRGKTRARGSQWEYLANDGMQAAQARRFSLTHFGPGPTRDASSVLSEAPPHKHKHRRRPLDPLSILSLSVLMGTNPSDGLEASPAAEQPDELVVPLDLDPRNVRVSQQSLTYTLFGPNLP